LNDRSSSRTHPNQATITTTDEDLLRRAMQDAGRWAYGIVLMEVQVLADDRTH
jgi:hypothetical protein